MIKQSISPIIIVEGKSDTANLKKYYDVTTVETNGFGLKKSKIDEIITLNKNNEIIIFTDQDFHGKKLREKLIKYLPNALHANLPYKHNKVGVEHATKEELDNALANLVDYSQAPKNEDINIQLIIELQIKGDRELRKFICDEFHIEMCNNKALIKKLNLINVTKDELNRIVRKYQS
jgi:ribonuclease M5